MLEKIETLPEKPLTRIITLVCDHIPPFRKIKKHEFVSILGSGAVFACVDARPSSLLNHS